MSYESRFERFEVVGLDGKARMVEFRRAGFLTVGDRPELYFFAVGGEDVVLAISGSALKKFEQAGRRLSREEKIDIAGLVLKRAIEAGKALDSQNLLIRDDSLAQLASELEIPA